METKFIEKEKPQDSEINLSALSKSLAQCINSTSHTLNTADRSEVARL